MATKSTALDYVDCFRREVQIGRIVMILQRQGPDFLEGFADDLERRLCGDPGSPQLRITPAPGEAPV